MLNIGATELIIILVVALLVLGPGRLPDVATGLGKAIREFKKAARDITAQLEVDDSIAKPFAELKSALNDVPAPKPVPKVEAPQPAPVPVGAAEPVPVPLPVPVAATPEPVPVPMPVAAESHAAPAAAAASAAAASAPVAAASSTHKA